MRAPGLRLAQGSKRDATPPHAEHLIDRCRSWHEDVMRLSSGLLFAALATTLTLASSQAFATTSGETGAGETSGDSGGGDSSSAWFVSPLPNAFYETAPVSIDVEIDVYQGLDDSITDIELFLDGTSVASLPCAEGCIFADVVLEQGVHELSFTAAPNGYASSLTVYVDAELPSGTEGESEGESGAESESGLGGADEADAGNDLEAKGCNAQGGNAAPWMLALPILVLAVRLRRERG